MRIATALLSVLALFLVSLAPVASSPQAWLNTRSLHGAQSSNPLPMIESERSSMIPGPLRRINAPYFASNVHFAETAIAWFGRVDPTTNYADLRIGYTATELYLYVAAFDRRLWYAPNPTHATLTAWDGVSLYISKGGNTGGAPDSKSYRFDAQMTWWENPRDNWQAVYQGNGSTWTAVSVPFTTTSGWRGDAPNNDTDDAGWAMEFHIPFSSLGLTAPPDPASLWGLAVAVHDRDDAAGIAIPDQTWPESLNTSQPGTWGQLAFGMPAYDPPPTEPGGTVTIRQGLNGAIVMDAAVGGGATCGAGLNYWTQWGDKNYAGSESLNVQNQDDVADWPCFSKYYVTFPLSGLPAGEVVVSAILTLYQTGNSGQGWNPPPVSSYIQVLTTSQDWSENTLTWNNAPLASENITGTWVDPLDLFPPWPGVARNWDISRAVANAYALGQPMRLIIYSADSAYHSGRYFTTSDAQDWDAAGRPALAVTWGKPAGTPVATQTPTGTNTPTPKPTRTPTASRTPTRGIPLKNHLYVPRLIR